MNTEHLIDLWLAEDCFEDDVTSSIFTGFFPEDYTDFQIILKSDFGVACGTKVGIQILQRCKSFLLLDFAPDSSQLSKEGCLIKGRADAKSLLGVERTVLNLVQYMCNVATKAHKFALIRDEIAPETQILDTRKTIPGLRALTKYAVRCGGLHNHRNNLSDAVLIKDNHIAIAGIDNILSTPIPPFKIAEIECDSVDDVQKVIEKNPEGIGIIMLDNFSPDQAKYAIAMIRKCNANHRHKRFKVDISGGVNISNIREYLALKPDYISVGSLTHEIESIDISLEII